VLLELRDLRIQLRADAGTALVVDGVCLAIERGETLALVGESGCGKSLTALAIIGLLPPRAAMVGGQVLLDGCDLGALSGVALRRLRGRRIAMIFQESMSALNPVLTVGRQIAEGLRTHLRLSRRPAQRRCFELLEQVGIDAPSERAGQYPHQLSGGMRQRVTIAMALACGPDLLIADEPTTALDVTIQAQILELLRRLQAQRRMAMLFITHDLAVVSQVADRACVMYAGRIVESAATPPLLAAPRHPYTAGLLRCTPMLEPVPSGEFRPGRPTLPVAVDAPARPTRVRMPVIPGEPPDPWRRPDGCAFHMRCPVAEGDVRCRLHIPALAPLSSNHRVACWKAPGYPADCSTPARDL
jgi:peptide/nickel transport system ATP-binding protein